MSGDFIREAQAAYQISGNPALKRLLAKTQGQYTVEDYYALPDDCRVELIDGVIYNMSAPAYIHQSIVLEIGSRLRDFIRNHKGDCMVFVAPADVQLDKDEKTMVQPDVFVICRKQEKEKDTKEENGEVNSAAARSASGYAFRGAPDFVAEVLSPSSNQRDRRIKYRKYKNAGVREYWLVDAKAGMVTVHWFGEGAETAVYTCQDEIPVRIFEGMCRISLKDIAENERLLAEMGIM